MKKYLYLVTIAFVSCYAVLSSRSNNKISDDSTFSTKAVERNAFDQRLYKNYIMPYNIDSQYRLKTEETEQAYSFVPADSAKTMKLAILTKYMQFDVYAETVGLDFIKENAPRIILVTDTPGYTRYHTEAVGSAEGSYKVRLGEVNALTNGQLKDYGSMNNHYLHTIHHEFMHILNQRESYDESYDNISHSDYVSSNWASTPDKKTQSIDFVSAYSMENPAEDITEFYSIYVTGMPENWATIMENMGNKGGIIINKKLKITREYTSSSWNVDIELLRNAVLRRDEKIGILGPNTLEQENGQCTYYQ